jgi:hypothetical protein
MYQKVILFSVVFQIETIFGPVSPIYTSPIQNEVTHWANDAIGNAPCRGKINVNSI